MIEEILDLRLWTSICLFVAALSTTAVPVIFARSKWERSALGRLFMLQAVAFALAMDLTFLRIFWHPSRTTSYIVAALVFTLIAAATASLAVLIWRLNRRDPDHVEKEITNVDRGFFRDRDTSES